MRCWKKRLSFSLYLIFFNFLLINQLQAQDCAVKPDATLTDARNGNTPFVNCTSSSITNYNLTVKNASTTKQTNTSYTIDWGDNSPVETFAAFDTRLHTYRTLGSFKLQFTATNGTCSSTKTYTVFNGSVPKLNIRLPGDTYDCALATFTFAIEDVQNNEPSTVYTFSFDDGTPALHFTQATVPATITHIFEKASIGKVRGFTMTGTATNACNATGRTADGIYVSNGPTPDFKMTPDGISCLNGQVTLTDISDYGFNAINPSQPDFERKWQIKPATGWSYAPGYDETSEKPVINFTQTGVYDISINLIPLSDNQKCKGGSAAKKLQVISPPTASFTSVLDPLSGCAASVITSNTSVGEGVSYLWTVTPSAGVTTTNGNFTSKEPIFKFANAGNYTINLRVTNSCGTSTATPQTVTIKNIPTVTLPTAKTYCGPQTIAFSSINANHTPTYNFNNTSAITYAWSVTGPTGGANFTTSNGTSLANPSIEFDQAGVYTVSVKVTNECGTSTQANQTITINAVPAAPTANNASICINTAATLTTTANGTIEWFSTPTGGTRLNTSPNNSYTTPVQNTVGTFTYYVQTTVNGCVSPRQTVTVTVNPAIDPKVITGASAICENNAPGLLTGPAATGGGSPISYLWESSTTGANATDFTTATGLSNSPNNQISFQPGVLSRTTYFRRKAVASPCATANSNVITITANPTPPIPIVTSVPPVCVGNSAILTANAVAGLTYTWYDENNVVLPNNSATSNSYTTAPFTREGTFTFYVSSKSTFNCISAKTTVTVQVLPAITNNRIASEQPAICAGETPGIISSAIPPTGGNGYSNFTYLWQSKTDRDTEWKTASNGIDVNYANNKENYQPTAITRTTSFRRVITSGSCATPSYSNEIVIDVIPSSLAPEVADVKPICAGESTQLRVTSTGGIYEWFTSPTAVNSVFTGSLFQTPALSGTTTYYVHNRTANCVSPRTPVIVTVNPVILKNTVSPVPVACSDEKPNKLIGSDPEGGAGPGTYTYRWESRTEFTQFSPVNNDFTFSIDKKDYAPAILSETTWFRRIVRSGTCQDISAEVKVEILKSLSGNTISASNGLEFCEGTVSTVLTGTGKIGGGTGEYTYIWESSTDGFQATKNIVAQGQDVAYATYSPQNLNQTTWFRRVILSGSCLANTSNIVKITINAKPATPVVAPIAAICVGSSATIIVNPVAGITFTITDEAGNSIPNNTAQSNRFTTPALTESKTYTYFVTATNNFNCVSAQTPVSIQVLPPLVNVNINLPGAVCKGESPAEITSLGNPAGGDNTYLYIWESKAIDETEFKIISAASSNPNFKSGPLTKTTFFRRQIRSGACTEYSNIVEVKVNEPINNLLTTANQEVCEDFRPVKILGRPATGGDGANYIYLWESSADNAQYAAAIAASGESNTQADFQPTRLTPGDWWFRRKVTSGTCVSYSTPILIKVNKTISDNTIRLTGTNILCTNTKPDVLQGSSPTGGTGTPTFLWQISIDGSKFINASQINNLKDFTPGNLNQTTWFRRITDVAACLPDTSNTVKIDVYSPVTNNTILTRDQEICLGNEAVVLEGSNPEKGNGQYTYRWESRRDNQAFITAAATGFSDPTAKNYAPGLLAKGVWYFRRWVSAGPCQEVVSQVVKVTVNEPISGHFITANQTIRVGDKPAPLTGSKPKGGGSTITYRWEIKNDATSNFQLITGNTNSVTFAPPVLSKTTWYRRIAISGGCESASNEIEITVAQAIANNIISANQTICYGAEPNILTGSKPTGGDGDFTYIWEYSATGLAADFVIAPNPSLDSDYQPGRLKQTTWFRRKVSSAGNTHLSNTVKITVAEPISENSITGNQIICYNTVPTILTGSNVTGGNNQPDYLWESSTDGIHFVTASGKSNQSSYTPGALTRSTWYRRNVSTGGCTNLASNTIQITVIPLSALAPVNPVTICPGTTATLTVNANNNQVEWFETATSTTPIHQGTSFTTPVLNTERTYYAQAVNQGCAGERIAIKVLLESPVANAGTDVVIEAGKSVELQGTGGVSYQWSPAEGLSDPNIANPIARPKETTRYTLTITNAQGCTATDEVVVALMRGISIPNGFTPNGDGQNDVWEIANIVNYPGCEVKIFNRWGTLLYTSSGYKQPWDGTYNQQALPVATYYYTIIIKQGEKPVSGSVTIIK